MMQAFGHATEPKVRRILIVDDNRAIHEDIRKSLANEPASTAEVDEMEALLFGDGAKESPPKPTIQFEISSAYQGEEGIELVRRAVREGAPYSLAFMDVRIPPGCDGIEALSRIWLEDPALQAVICSAYSDYSWTALVERLPRLDGFLVLRKPFDALEIRQMAYALTEKWTAHADIQTAAEVLAQISMPFIPISDRVAVMPLIGDLDGRRVERIRETLLERISERNVSTVIVDFTGIGNLDTAAAEELIRNVQSVRLLGAELILTGVRSIVARRLVEIGANFSGIAIRQTLQDGILWALRRR